MFQREQSTFLIMDLYLCMSQRLVSLHAQFPTCMWSACAVVRLLCCSTAWTCWERMSVSGQSGSLLNAGPLMSDMFSTSHNPLCFSCSHTSSTLWMRRQIRIKSVWTKVSSGLCEMNFSVQQQPQECFLRMLNILRYTPETFTDH